MWCVDAYQIPYYSRGIEEAKRTHPRFDDWLSPCPFSIVRFEVHVRHVIFMEYVKIQTYNFVVRDSSAVRRLFFVVARAVGRQRALHEENSGFASPTLGRHISTFCGYRILFSIRNPYINRFTNHFSIHSSPSYPQKLVLHSITARFCLRSYYSSILKSSNVISRY
jgi:hypothetical protein